MDPDKIFKFLAENTAEFSAVVVQTLSRPVSRFELVPAASADSSPLALRGISTRHELWLHPKLLAFAVLSVILGSAVNGLIPNRRSGPDTLHTTVVTLLCWFVYASLLHFACKLMRGKGTYAESLSVTLQVVGTLYVVASVIALMLGVLVSSTPGQTLVLNVPILGEYIADDPGLMFFVASVPLSVVYVPLGLRAVHRFGWVRTVCLAILPLGGVVVAVVLYLSLGLLLLGPEG